MKERDIVNALLGAVSRQAGIDGLALDDHGVCALDYDDGLPLAIEHPDGAPSVYLHAALMPVPTIGQEDLFRRLLSMNFLSLETRGCTLAIDERSNAVSLCYGVLLEGLEATAFNNLIGNFIENAIALRDQLATAGHDGQPPPSPGMVDLSRLV